MKTRRNKRNQRGGAKAKPMNDPMNALTRGMGSLKFGLKKSKPFRFGAKTKKHVFAKKSGVKTLTRKPKKPAKTLRGLVRTQLVQRNEMTTNMEQFEPAEYVRKVGGVFKGLGGVRERIEARGKTQLLDGFDMIISSIYEGLPKIRGAMGQSKNVNMNASDEDEDVDEMLEEIEDVGEDLVELSKTYRKRVKHTSQNVSNIQVQLIGVAEAVNQVLIDSVPKVARANTNQNMSGLLAQLGDMTVKNSSVNDLSSLLAGLGM
jgi:hypothetical protein